MTAMFQSTFAFNQPLSGWNTSSVFNMQNMFASAREFNNGLASGVTGTLTWNTSGVTSMNSMFTSAWAFNQDIGNWDVSKVTDMTAMFQSTFAFNQPLSGWNTSSVYNMSSMFNNGYVFNNGLASGVTGTLTWNTSGVTSMNSMFTNAWAFNQNINSWDVSKVTDMANMFQSTFAFNQPLSGWNVSKVTNMQSMFASAREFNQNIGNWNVSGVSFFANFMAGKTPATFSTTNLDAIYNGWITKLLIVTRSISFGTAKYTSAATEGKALLTRANVSLTVTGAINNGSGLIRITTSTVHGRTTGNKVFISAVTGAIQANGLWTVTVISTTQVDLQGSTFSSAYISGGAFRTGYGWTVADGGI
jgi:surface protein